MKKIKENISWIIALVALIALIVGPIWIAVYAILPPSKEKMEECFQEDKTDLAVAVEYLCSIDYVYASIDKSKLEEGLMFIGAGTGYQTIENASVIEVLDRLLGWGGYNRIRKSDQTIVFEKWDLFAKSRGIAYVIQEGAKPKVEFLIHSEPLSEKGWYYYETGYEESRIRNELW